ncbi:hypothetical protein [Chryseolinea lacunae]|uniref:Uncharacterized protein n=1 Tax=Chryseolinea lacunae TaxID=2801331 RepID=A0ABS1KWD4_9BACT|nr:hypothetical protein [Chryseolinea lacunae]MBL0743567.1 hypothetical protein [Chryseolinea lacunae]
MMMEDTLLELNKKFSLEEYKKLKPAQATAFKNNLKQAIGNLKGRHTLKVLDDDYLFSIAATKPSYSMMEMVNDYRELIFKQRNTKDDRAQTNLLQEKKVDLWKKMLEAMFGGYSLFYVVDKSTIAMNQHILNAIVG